MNTNEFLEMEQGQGQVEEVDYGSSFTDPADVRRVWVMPDGRRLDFTGLQELRERLPGVYFVLRNMEAGTTRRVVYMRPDNLVSDEAVFRALDRARARLKPGQMLHVRVPQGPAVKHTAEVKCVAASSTYRRWWEGVIRPE